MFERGLLKWKEFSERPENLFLELSFWPRMRVRPIPDLTLGVGYRHFAQERYRYDGTERVFERRYRGAGPTASLVWEGEGWQRLAIDGWYEVQKDGDRTIRRVSNVTAIIGLVL
jgi:hypothetical protein